MVYWALRQECPIYMVEVGGIEPHTRVVAQGLTPYCDHIVTTFLHLFQEQHLLSLDMIIRL